MTHFTYKVILPKKMIAKQTFCDHFALFLQTFYRAISPRQEQSTTQHLRQDNPSDKVYKRMSRHGPGSPLGVQTFDRRAPYRRQPFPSPPPTYGISLNIRKYLFSNKVFIYEHGSCYVNFFKKIYQTLNYYVLLLLTFLKLRVIHLNKSVRTMGRPFWIIDLKHVTVFSQTM